MNIFKMKRLEKKLSQQEVCAELNLSQAWLSKLENNSVDPKLSDAFKLCRFFKINIKDLEKYFI